MNSQPDAFPGLRTPGRNPNSVFVWFLFCVVFCCAGFCKCLISFSKAFRGVPRGKTCRNLQKTYYKLTKAHTKLQKAKQTTKQKLNKKRCLGRALSYPTQIRRFCRENLKIDKEMSRTNLGRGRSPPPKCPPGDPADFCRCCADVVPMFADFSLFLASCARGHLGGGLDPLSKICCSRAMCSTPLKCLYVLCNCLLG